MNDRVFCALCVFGLMASFCDVEAQLLPFQGRLSAPNGDSLDDGARVVQFKMYDAPVGGRAVWNGEVHQLSVNGGMVNTILGSKSSLSGVNFGSTLYLEITVDANKDGEISPVDPPLLPRQSVIASAHAVRASGAEGILDSDGISHDWSVVFGENDPVNSKIPGGRIESATITKENLAPALVFPTGAVIPFAGAVSNKVSIPTGWLLCDGRAVSREAYPDLALVLGDLYGETDEGMFRLPNMSGRVPSGVNTGDGMTTRSLGETFGAETHTLTLEEMPAHAHEVDEPPHGHSLPFGNGATTGGSGIDSGSSSGTSLTHKNTTGLRILESGGGEPHPIAQPSIALNFLIKI